MRGRYMRMILFFDLPMVTKRELREYRKFRNYILSEGFIMQQESVYSKLLLNHTNVKLLQDRLILNAPAEGLVETLTITELQYSSIEMIVGSRESNVMDHTERVIFL